MCRTGVDANRWVIVTDSDVDVTNLDELIYAALTRADPAEDFHARHRDDPDVRPVAHHGVALSGPGLAVGEHRRAEALQGGVQQRLDARLVEALRLRAALVVQEGCSAVSCAFYVRGDVMGIGEKSFVYGSLYLNMFYILISKSC